ncbi:MAG: hypothetical protein JJT76_02440, partial [Clostridiaceae bacterium]|nr:hypothetical protein [Clostridiaceae bacterium]
KKIISLGLIVVLFLCSTGSVFADQEEVTTETKTLLETDELTIHQTTEAFEYLTSFRSYLDYYGDGEILVRAQTMTSEDVDSISTKAYLQRYDEDRGVWINVGNVFDSQENTDYSRANKTYTVDVGYNYRVFSIHSVENGSTTESATSATKGTYIY